MTIVPAGPGQQVPEAPPTDQRCDHGESRVTGALHDRAAPCQREQVNSCGQPLRVRQRRQLDHQSALVHHVPFEARFLAGLLCTHEVRGSRHNGFAQPGHDESLLTRRGAVSCVPAVDLVAGPNVHTHGAPAHLIRQEGPDQNPWTNGRRLLPELVHQRSLTIAAQGLQLEGVQRAAAGAAYHQLPAAWQILHGVY